MAVVTVHMVSQSIRGVLDGTPISAISHSHVLTAPTLTEENYFELRARWRRGDLPDVQAMAPVIDDFIDFGDQPYRIVGFDPLAGAAAYAGPAPYLSATDARTGADAFLTDDVLIAGPGTADAIRVAGVPATVLDARRAGTTATGGPEVLVADLPTAQRLLDREGQLDAVWLRVATARSRLLVALDGLLPGITAALPRYADPDIDGYRVVAVRRWNPASRFADALAFTLGALSLLSMLMAALVAAQASFSNAARRRLEHERLMAIGVSRRFLNWLGIAEGLVLGMVGTVVGIGLGFAISDWLLDTAFGADNTVQLDAWIIAKAAVCGLAISATGAAFAHREPRDLGRSRHVAGLVGFALAAYGLVNPSLLSAFGGLVGLCAAQMAFGVPLAGSAAAKLAAMARSIGARGNLRAAAARVGELRLALGALSVAVATAVGMGLMVESLRQDFTTMLDQRLWPGITVSVERALTAEDEDWVRTRSGVQAVRRYGDLDFRLARGPARLSLAELDRPESARYEFNGVLTELAMVNEVGARLYDLAVGDTVTVTGRGTTLDVEIGHVFRDFGAPAPRVILPMAFESSLPVDAIRWRRFAVLADAAALPRLTAALAARFGAANVRNQSDIRDIAMDVFDRTFVVSRALTSVALAVAVIGLYAALTALQASREREFKLLSAIGYSRGGIWRLAVAQTSILGAVAAVSALPLGIAIAWTLCQIIQPLAFGWSINLDLHLKSIAVPVLLGIAGAAAAGAVPAYRSSFGPRRKIASAA